MNDTASIIRNMVRQALILMAIVALTFAAGINWAEAAALHGGNAGVSPLPVVLILTATLGALFGLMMQARQPARIRTGIRSRR